MGVERLKPTAISINMTLLLSYSSTLFQLHSIVDSQLTECGLSGGLGWNTDWCVR
jgi:hypothetical protein